MPHVHYRIDDAVVELILDNPPQNRIDDEAGADLARGVERAQIDGARAILVHAEGDDFSFGGDIAPWPELGQGELRAKFEGYLDAFNRLENLEIPVISAVRGLCFGGGFELALRTDVIFAGNSARFGHPEQSIGIVTLLGGIYRVAARAGRARAMEWAITSEQVPASTMAEAGVINHVVPDDEVLDAARTFAHRAAAGPTRAHAIHKALLRVWESAGTPGADDIIFDLAMPLFETDDVRMAIPAAVEATLSGVPRPVFDFQGR